MMSLCLFLVVDFAAIAVLGFTALPNPVIANTRNRLSTKHQSFLWYRNETATPSLSEESNTLPSLSSTQDDEVQIYRNQLKQALAVAAIEEYDMEAYNAGMTTIAEDLMKELEQVCPWPNPAYHPQLNARWSFVFTGVPTIGMKLITLLSRISVGVSQQILDFDNVFLEVSGQQSQVKAIVRIEVLGQPVELNVFTNLQKACEPSSGTLLIESFEKLMLMGMELPTPQSWKSSRTLQITYLDDDMMLARTAGGEPHLLLRHSPCSTDDEACDLDTEAPTQYFQDALAKYGKHLSRSLVDRAYTCMNGEAEGTQQHQLDVKNIIRLIRGILISPDGGH